MLTFSLNIFSYTNCMLKTVFIFINISLLSKMCNKSFIFSRLGGCCLLHLTRKCGLSSLSSGPEGAPLTGHQELWQPQEHQHPQALEEVHQQELHWPGKSGERCIYPRRVLVLLREHETSSSCGPIATCVEAQDSPALDHLTLHPEQEGPLRSFQPARTASQSSSHVLS